MGGVSLKLKIVMFIRSHRFNVREETFNENLRGWFQADPPYLIFPTKCSQPEVVEHLHDHLTTRYCHSLNYY